MSGVRADAPELRAAARAATVAVGVQLLHFAEELATGFPERFPEQLGLSPLPVGFFVAFNLFWLIVWAWSAHALLAGRRLAVAALWFLAIAGVVNAVAHPALGRLLPRPRHVAPRRCRRPAARASSGGAHALKRRSARGLRPRAPVHE